MNYRKYQKILIFFLACITLAIFFYFAIILNLISPTRNSAIANLYFYFFSVTSICFFNFSLYSFFIKIATPRNIEHPLVMFGISTILIIISFAWPIKSYYFIYKARDDQQLVQSMQTLVDDISMNTAFDLNKRIDVVKKYYHVTGEKKKYLDNNGKETIFLPQKNDELMHKKYAETLAGLDRLLEKTETEIKALLLFLGISIIFSIFIYSITKKK